MIALFDQKNGEIKVHNENGLIGTISYGEVYGEWWVEPIGDKKPELIKGKQAAIKYLQ